MLIRVLFPIKFIINVPEVLRRLADDQAPASLAFRMARMLERYARPDPDQPGTYHFRRVAKFLEEHDALPGEEIRAALPQFSPTELERFAIQASDREIQSIRWLIKDTGREDAGESSAQRQHS